MKPSRKYLSLPIISLQEGQQIGYVKSLILDAATKSLAAIVVDSKGFFKDQRIIPYAKVVSVGDDAITIDTGSHVEKTSSLPDLLDLVKGKLSIIGTKMVTETGKTLGIADEYYVDPKTGKITQVEISGGKLEGFLSGKAWISAEHIMTIGHDVIVTKQGSESALTIADKGLNDTLKNLIHSTSSLATETTHTIGSYFKKDKAKVASQLTQDKPPIIIPETESTPSACQTTSEMSEIPQTPEIPVTKEPLG
ncbi:PRC-barrel domain-containing protein [Desulfosporosinus sp. Sb-LF]|uniref:PRC-barrel domain-containing protein n=1 Tax=Desulfosporosinus sp. Sb-LF TaxID=2560027 RepID=UPI00107F7DDE|nr:PRC-barrel domain-containing protein [Desulfosporosinus sp. Sb-LF]TGE34076.1 photosystem reaction center subunit H [Desulfosporosinus sp. Sb-LF]